MTPLGEKLANLVLRGRIIKAQAGPAGYVAAEVETYSGSVHRGVPILQDFGIASVPPPNSRCVLVAVGGDADHYICIATQQSPIGPLGEGEAALASAAGSRVKVAEGVSVVGDATFADSVTVAGRLETEAGAVTLGGEGFDVTAGGGSLMDELGMLCDQLAALANAVAPPQPGIAAAVAAIKARLLLIKGGA